MLLLKVLKVLDNVVSSVHMIKSDMLLAFEISFVYIINNSGSIIDLDGTSIVMGKVSFDILFSAC